MTDAPQSTALTTEPAPALPATRPPRDRIVVESAYGIMDTARFEHYGRVATVLAEAGLLPKSITHEKSGNNEVALDMGAVKARAFLIVSQAANWGADPLAVAQATSLVHGRLMYEGKLIHALIETRAGVRLRYEFGTYNHSTRTVDLTKIPGGDDKALGVQVTGRFEDEDFDRVIVGSVAMWETTGANTPWGKSANWPRQLRYRGAREWARAHQPAIILGVLTSDEIDDYELGRMQGTIPAPGAPALTAEFVDAPAPPPKKPRASKAPAPIEPIEPTTVEEAPPAPEVKAEPAAEEEAPVSEGGIFVGPAPADTVYILSDEEPGEDGKIQTYENGEPMSRVDASEEALDSLPVYDTHPEGTEKPNDSEVESEGSDAVEVEEPVEDAGEKQPPEFLTYIRAVEGAPTWADVRKAMQTFYATELFKGMAPDKQNGVRANTWDAVLDSAMADKPDQALDVSAFRLWIEWVGNDDGMSDQEAIGAINGTLDALRSTPSFTGAPEATQNAIAVAAQARIATLRG